MSPGEFYSAVYNKAIELGANDVQARLAAAQASEETGFGKSMVGNNAFGIKAGSTYTGPSVTASTEEEYNGNTVRENANFRAYDDITESVKDYLSTIQQNFPDAWSAPTFSEAVKGLNTGVYGKYATRAAYGQHVKAIDNKYGALQYAQNPENVPTPYGPNENVDISGTPNDVIPVDDPNFVPLDPQFAFAAAPSNVPIPQEKPAQPVGGGLLTAIQDQQPAAQSPFDSVLSTNAKPNEWGVLNGVTPALIPTFNQWDQVASAPPVQSPMGSVQASGLLGTTLGLPANATVSGLPQVASSNQNISQADVDRAFFNATGAGVFDPSFTAGLMSPQNPVVPTAVETTSYSPSAATSVDIATSRFSTPAKTSRAVPSPTLTDTARVNPLTGAIDPATNTQSFMDQPAAAANLGSFPDAYAAQRGPSAGLLSADFQTVQGNTERQMQDQSSLAPMVQTQTTMMDVPASGLLAGNSPLSAQASVPALGPTAAQQAVGYQQAANSLRQAGIMNIGQQPPTDLSGELPTNFDVLGTTAPALETVTVADQPAVVDQNSVVEGPATTPAREQQKQATVTPTDTVPSTISKPATQNKSILSGLLSPEALGGGLLGGLALGPAGGVLGALAGQQVARNGGLSGLLSGGGFMAPTSQIAGGVNNIGGIYGGAYSPGTFAVANNGATITAQPGGFTTYENKYGVVESIGPDGKIASYFGGGYDPVADPSTDTEGRTGGLFGGLFG